jgi:hypothetical protein
VRLHPLKSCPIPIPASCGFNNLVRLVGLALASEKA